MSEKRKDNKGRILATGESQRRTEDTHANIDALRRYSSYIHGS